MMHTEPTIAAPATPPTHAPIRTPPSARRNKWTVLLAAISLAVVLAVLLRGIGRGEFNINIDETVHAVTGLYAADFIRTMPLRHPVEYTYRWYAHYPELGIILYPPVFYAAEGAMFLLFGASVPVARLTTLLFALLGLIYWFKLVKELEDERTAAVSTVLLAFLPSVLLYEKAVMLDVPVMALCIAASYYWMLYLRRGSPRLLYVFGIFGCLALLTKQHAIYLPLWCVAAAAAERKWLRILNWKAVATACVCALVLAPVYGLQFELNHSLAHVLNGTRSNAGLGLGYYWAHLPHQIGWGALILSGAGILTCRLWIRREAAAVMLTWILVCWVVFTAIPHKDPDARYILNWTPPFCYFAVAPFLRRSGLAWARICGVLVVGLVLASYTVRAWSFQRPYVSGYAQIAQRLSGFKGGCVLVDMQLPGNFIFFVRADDPSGRFIVLRRALHAVRILPQWGTMEFAPDRSKVEKVLEADAVNYVVVENGSPLAFKDQKVLREIVAQGSDYEPVETVAIQSNMRSWHGRSLTLYRRTSPFKPPHGILHIAMPSLPYDLNVPFSALSTQR